MPPLPHTGIHANDFVDTQGTRRECTSVFGSVRPNANRAPCTVSVNDTAGTGRFLLGTTTTMHMLLSLGVCFLEGRLDRYGTGQAFWRRPSSLLCVPLLRTIPKPQSILLPSTPSSYQRPSAKHRAPSLIPDRIANGREPFPPFTVEDPNPTCTFFLHVF
ncbi:hypothetical protein HGRIS_006636 [Hohenbuehelia grisea]|uniref:Uncharacterized protein n=1 Tax=Hohenbuehelia grisea TaxID=104357 RepID=A0ABR3J9Y2_9AGAR